MILTFTFLYFLIISAKNDIWLVFIGNSLPWSTNLNLNKLHINYWPEITRHLAKCLKLQLKRVAARLKNHKHVTKCLKCQILGGMFVIFQNVLSNVQNIRTQTLLSKLAAVLNRPLSHAAIFYASDATWQKNGCMA